jgi:hypothetical protein
MKAVLQKLHETNLSAENTLEHCLDQMRSELLSVSAKGARFSQDFFLADLESLYPSTDGNRKDDISNESMLNLILIEEYGDTNYSPLLDWGVKMMNDLNMEIKLHVDQVVKCRDRDLARGVRVIPDYSSVAGFPIETKEELNATLSYTDIDVTLVTFTTSTDIVLRNVANMLHALMNCY